MAAPGPSFIRLRLFFDYPPPAVVGCRMCWLLVDLNSCRFVADLESTIRERFEFGRRSILSLFVEDCYLPHTESIYVVRDNDSVRVKVDCLAQVNGHGSFSDPAAETCRKRQRDTGEDGSGGESLSAHCKKKKKKKKKRLEETSAEETHLVTAANKNEKSQGKKHKTKKRKKSAANSHAATPKPAAPPHKKALCVSGEVKSSKNTLTAQGKEQNTPSSDSSSSSSEEKNASGKKAAKASSSVPAASKANTKHAQTPARTPSSSSSETDSSSDEAVKAPPKPNSSAPTTSTSNSPKAACTSQTTNSSQKPAAGPVPPPPDTLTEACDQDSEDDIQLIIKHPQRPPQSMAGLWGDRSRRKDGFWAGAGPRDGWKDEGNKKRQSSFESSHKDAKEPSYQTDSLTNVSVVLQNGAESVPQKDYSSMPLLAAPPQVGQTIAFKLLELTESYTPEISEYKEGKIISFDPTTKHVELKLLNASQAPVEPGKFDLVYQNPDGSESVEYAVSRGSWVTERWESLLEPRLVI
ncbi:coilin isoform X2 [Kryptolebias marmoratus]|uniref:coilin isoform X2 n=1 Tax=Kryptolebias marmoratus TaxID=37003 RepID=UPI0007F8D65F|nr:coilin isoform X2 [Kryptolebias marmoratus]